MPPTRLLAPVTVVFLLLLSAPRRLVLPSVRSGDAFMTVTEYLYRGQAVWEALSSSTSPRPPTTSVGVI
jgi:hypothetical protein